MYNINFNKVNEMLLCMFFNINEIYFENFKNIVFFYKFMIKVGDIVNLLWVVLFFFVVG